MTFAQAVTWIRVEKPSLDLVGVVLGSFKLAGVIVLVALVLGVVGGAALILSRRRHAPAPLDDLALHLEPPAPPTPPASGPPPAARG